MAKVTGYVGTIATEVGETNYLWFALTIEATGDDWIHYTGPRVWFALELERNQAASAAIMELLVEAMRSGLQVQVGFDRPVPYEKFQLPNVFEINGIRVLRSGLHFEGVQAGGWTYDKTDDIEKTIPGIDIHVSEGGN